jgi:nicotinamide-nucleotide amidase
VTIRSAELLSIGTELTVGETRDTNSGDLARDLAGRGVVVRRIEALPDDLAVLRDAFAAAAARSDLVVSTGGLGPTPDDLTREAIAATLGETPAVDPELERWLRGLFERRRLPFPAANRKQAWLIPSAEVLPNPNGTAPGWLARHPGGSVLVALPGPPREMTPMWRDEALPRLEAIGLGTPAAVVTLRLTGIGESAVADRLGPLLDPTARPSVATYARAEAVDVRISALEHVDDDAGAATELVAATERQIVALLGAHVWARGRTTWAEAIGNALDRRGWRLAAAEVGLRGALTALLGEGLGERLALAESRPSRPRSGRAGAARLASVARTSGAAEVGLGAEVRARGDDTAVTVTVDGPLGTRRETRVVFTSGPIGRGRAAIAAAAVLLAYLDGRPPRRPDGRGVARPATVSRT